MARHLTDIDVNRILALIDSWQYDLKWEALVKACEINLGIKTTRQALSRKQQIKEAFQTYKKTQKLDLSDVSAARPNDINTAHQRIERLLKRIEKLEYENRLLKEKFLVWQYNAEQRGVTEEMLHRPIPRHGKGDNY
ncbi:hypothetical protein [Marinobacter subterrani]|uniref:hypothetical protein n=1 Tax=Marinobacter subterrani TaxID=1658765 RepID=UPI002355F81A|nr:hypothetical protein [Marinobacter subterrani]